MGPVRCVFFIGLMFGAVPVSAQVLEIDGDGAVTIHDGPAVTTSKASTPIQLRGDVEMAFASTAMRGERWTQAPAAVESLIMAAARDFRVDPDLVRAVAWHESRYQQKALSSKGAIGIMQLMPGTARTLGVDPFDAEQNVRGGAAFLAQLTNRYRGDVKLALAAYSAGPGAVARFGGVPPYAETQSYVASILARLGAVQRTDSIN